MTKNTFFIWVCVWVLIWIWIQNILKDFSQSLFLLLFFLFVLLNFCIYLRDKLYVYFVMWVFCFAVWWVILSHLHMEKQNEIHDLIHKYELSSKQEYMFEIQDVYKIKDYTKEYRVRIILYDNHEEISGIMILPYNLSPLLWDQITWKWQIKRIRNFDGNNYRDFMYSKGLYFKIYLSNFEKIWSRKPHAFLDFLQEKRDGMIAVIRDLYPKDEAVFLWGILLWARENIAKETQEHFNNSWLTHFIAVSWFNITILIVFFGFFLRYFPLWLRFVCMSFFVITFVLFVWVSAPVVRAAIMWIVAYGVLLSWRKGDMISILLLSLVWMVIFSPMSLNYDVSLHLSFLAVLWIIYFYDFFKKIFFFLPSLLGIKEAVVMTMSAFVLTLPIMLVNFGQLSLIAPVSNLMVAWTIGPAMLFWFLSLILFPLSYFISLTVAYITWVLLKWDMIMVKTFWTMEQAIVHYDFSYYKSEFLMIYFLCFVFYMWWHKKRSPDPGTS